MNKFEKAKAAKSKEKKTITLRAFENRMRRQFERESVAMQCVRYDCGYMRFTGRYWGHNFRTGEQVFNKWYEKELIVHARDQGWIKPNIVVEGYKW